MTACGATSINCPNYPGSLSLENLRGFNGSLILLTSGRPGLE